MSSVNGVNPNYINQFAAKNDSSDAASSANIVSKTEFLELLVAQLKNQDPINPVNNDQFITQLATFSSLEQLISINQAITSLAENYEPAGNSEEPAGREETEIPGESETPEQMEDTA